MQSRDRRLSSRGFSLVELLLVCAMIGALMVVTLPALDNMNPTQRLRSAARVVGTTMSLARAEAAISGVPVPIRYDFNGPGVSVLVWKGDGTGADGDGAMEAEGFPDGVEIERVVLADGKPMAEDKAEVQIGPTGEDGSHIVVLRNDADARMWVKLSALSGAVTYSAEEMEFREYAAGR